MAKCDVEVDTRDAQLELDQLRENADFTATSIMSITKKGYQSLRLLGDIFGIAIPMWFDLMATAAIMAGETFAELAAAETASGWLIAKAGVTFSISLMLFYRALTIQQQKTEVENKLNSILILGNLWF